MPVRFLGGSGRSNAPGAIRQLRQRGVRAGKHNPSRRRRESRGIARASVDGVELHMHPDVGVCSIGYDELTAVLLLRQQREHAVQPAPGLWNGRPARAGTSPVLDRRIPQLEKSCRTSEAGLVPAPARHLVFAPIPGLRRRRVPTHRDGPRAIRGALQSANVWASERDVGPARRGAAAGPSRCPRQPRGRPEADTGSGQKAARIGVGVAGGRRRAGAGRVRAFAVAANGLRSGSWATEWCAVRRWSG